MFTTEEVVADVTEEVVAEELQIEEQPEQE
jgi:hypothetical protein